MDWLERYGMQAGMLIGGFAGAFAYSRLTTPSPRPNPRRLTAQQKNAATEAMYEMRQQALGEPISESAGMARVQRLRVIHQISGKRNIAYAEIGVDDLASDAYSVSGSLDRYVGEVPVPVGSRHFSSKIVGFSRAFDSEAKLMEFLSSRMSQSSLGYVKLFSQRPICNSCDSVIMQFARRYPLVNVVSSAGT